jgi:hypothetical protein
VVGPEVGPLLLFNRAGKKWAMISRAVSLGGHRNPLPAMRLVSPGIRKVHVAEAQGRQSYLSWLVGSRLLDGSFGVGRDC